MKKSATVESTEKRIFALGLKPLELKANATTQSRKYVDPKTGLAYISFKNGHVARTVEGENGARISINPTKEGERVMLKTEPARLNRIAEYVELHRN
jgi:hypothetical protein